MTVKAYCDRCGNEIPDDTKDAAWLEFCDISEAWKPEGSLEAVALLCGGCVKHIRNVCNDPND